ncbi:c-type cytochrome [Planctomycetales bacterium ZRK34]|nr:c-type cytochrome [Planctomycetales bacterium ZRK34]
MINSRRLLWFTIAALLVGLRPVAAADLPFEIPDGFEINIFADDDMATNIYSLAIDSRGRVVVSGPGYVKILHDDDHDGRADRFTYYAKRPNDGAMGMCFDGTDLLCYGEGSILHFRDADGNDQADGDPERIAKYHGGEHGAHAIVQGPDGWFYLLIGNMSGVSEADAQLPTSPVKHPVNGSLIRFSPDLKTREVIADGFRNPYDFDFNSAGSIFTYDSDGESTHHLPWYAPTRVFDIQQGQHHGWVMPGWKRSWSRPYWWIDSGHPVANTDRGSPTGVCVYRHTKFPERYRDGLFIVCWTFGRIYFIPMTRDGATYHGEVETFIQSTGTDGFDPVDAVVGPNGDMYVAIGGRGTRGTVFRITYTGKTPQPAPPTSAALIVLNANDPLSSWSRLSWEPLARGLGKATFEQATVDQKLTPAQRIRAIEVLVELFDGLTPDMARAAIKGDPTVTARVAWALSRQQPTDASLTMLAELTHHDNAFVQRTAWDALAVQPKIPADMSAKLDWARALDSHDEFVRSAMVRAAQGPAAEAFAQVAEPKTPRAKLIKARVVGTKLADYFDRCLAAVQVTDDPALQVEALRLIQLGLGDVPCEETSDEFDTGYAALKLDAIDKATREKLIDRLAAVFPGSTTPVNYELARLFSMLKADRPKLLDAITGLFSEATSPTDDIHYLLCMAHMPGERSSEVRHKLAHAIGSLNAKIDRDKMLVTGKWSNAMMQAWNALVKYDPALPDALLNDPAFGHREHTIFARTFSGKQQLAAVRRLIAAAGDSAWSSELVRMSGQLPAKELRPLLLKQAPLPGQRDIVINALAPHVTADDANLMREGLASTSRATVVTSAKALRKIKAGPSDDALVAAVAALGRYEQDKPAREALTSLLSQWTGAESAAEWSQQAWIDWVAKKHPELADLLAQSGGEDLGAWRKRLAKIDWSSGDVARGLVQFQARACAACHTGSQRLGPGLENITQRFSTEDLFIHTVAPNLAISETYKAVQITTKDGAVWIGSIVYNSPASRIIEVGPGQQIRLTGDQIDKIEPATISPMPPALLTGATDENLADLYAYLKTLK